MEKKQVSRSFYGLIQRRVQEIEAELNDLHAESCDYLANGHKSTPELENEERLQRMLKEAKAVLKSCAPVSTPKNNDVVQIGSYVTLLFGDITRTIRLEGVAYFDRTVCSLETRLGKKLLGAKKGEIFLFNNSAVKVLDVGSLKKENGK